MNISNKTIYYEKYNSTENHLVFNIIFDKTNENKTLNQTYVTLLFISLRTLGVVFWGLLLTWNQHSYVRYSFFLIHESVFIDLPVMGGDFYTCVPSAQLGSITCSQVGTTDVVWIMNLHSRHLASLKGTKCKVYFVISSTEPHTTFILKNIVKYK